MEFSATHDNMTQQALRHSSKQSGESALGIIGRVNHYQSPTSTGLGPVRLFSTRGNSRAIDVIPLGLDTVEKGFLSEALVGMITINQEVEESKEDQKYLLEMVNEANAEIALLNGERVMVLEAQFASYHAIVGAGDISYIQLMQSGAGTATLPNDLADLTKRLEDINNAVDEKNLKIASLTQDMQANGNMMESKAKQYSNLTRSILNTCNKHNVAQANAGRRTDLVLKHCYDVASGLEDSNGAGEVIRRLFAKSLAEIRNMLQEQEAHDQPFEPSPVIRRLSTLENGTFDQAREEAFAFIEENFDEDKVAEVKRRAPSHTPANQLIDFDQLLPLKLQGARRLLKHIVVHMNFTESRAFLNKANSKDAAGHVADGVPEHVAEHLASESRPIILCNVSGTQTRERLTFLLQLTTVDDEGEEEDDE